MYRMVQGRENSLVLQNKIYLAWDCWFNPLDQQATTTGVLLSKAFKVIVQVVWSQCVTVHVSEPFSLYNAANQLFGLHKEGVCFRFSDGVTVNSWSVVSYIAQWCDHVLLCEVQGVKFKDLLSEYGI